MINIEELKEINQKYLNKYNQALGRKNTLIEELRKKQEIIGAMQNRRNDLLVMKEVVDKASEEARQNSVDLLENVSTNALQTVMGSNRQVILKMVKRNGLSSAELFVKTDHDSISVETSPAAEDAGGVTDIVALATLMSIRMLSGKNNSAPYFLDEPTKCVSSGNAEKTAKFLKELTDYSEIQTIMVTHERDYLPSIADKSYLLELDSDGNTVAKEIK